MKSTIALVLGSVLLALTPLQTLAAVPLATTAQDRNAKQAVPPLGKALIYVYRLEDGNPKATPGVWLNNRDSGQLEPLTYGMWAANPGRFEVRAGRADAAPLSFNCEAGRTYFIQLAVKQDGGVDLKQVPQDAGRKAMGQARLVLDPATAASMAAAPVPFAPAPVKETTPVAQKAPVTAAAPAEAGGMGVTLTLKVGIFQSLSDNHNVNATNLRTSTSSFVYGLEGEWRHENGLAVGLELFGHSQDYTATASSGSGDVALSYIFVNAKKYFETDNFITGTVVQPYLGVGIGRTTASYSGGSGGVTGGVDSNALQAMAGVVLRWQYVDLFTEYKYLHDKYYLGGTEVNASGNGLFVGVSVHF